MAIKQLPQGVTKQITLPSNSTGYRNRLAFTLILVGGATLIGLLWVNLAYAPPTWFDEGEHLRVSKTLVQYGQYAVREGDGFRYFGPTIGVGPTVLLPIAAIFKIWGIGLMQARAVIALYLLALTALFGLYLWCTSRSEIYVAFGVMFAFALPSVGLLALGRQVLGEVPALAFFVAGLLVWQRATTSQSWRWSLLVGILWALAAITKSTYGLLLPPILAVLWLVQRFYYHHRAGVWHSFSVPIACIIGGLGGWYVVVLVFLGGGDFWGNLNLLRAASGGSAFIFAPARIASALKFLFSPDDFFGLPIAGLLYGTYLARRRAPFDNQAIVLAFCWLWFGWFAFASIGWPRYAFPPLVMSSVFVARLIHDAPHLIAVALRRQYRQRQITRVVRICAILWAMVGFVPQVVALMQRDDSAERMAQYLNTNINNSALVETWESEMAFLTDHRYHSPPADLLDKAVRYKWLNPATLAPAQIYRAETLTPDFILDGQFARWNDLYPASLLNAHYSFVVGFGNYRLYQRIR